MQEFVQKTKANTKYEVDKLMASEEYKKYLSDKKNGNLKPIQYDEDDNIKFSDEKRI